MEAVALVDDQAPEISQRKVSDVLTREEIAELNRKSNLAGWWKLAFNWGMVGAVLAVAGLFPNPVTVLLALLLVGNRQLGLAVLMHDCGHRGLFRSRRLNDLVGHWLAAAPNFSDLEGYRKKHAKHHLKAGSEEDPDLENYRHYAVSKASFRRKILRDLTARTGVKTLALFLRYASWKARASATLAQMALLGACWLAGRPWLYLVWLGSYLTTYMLYARLRQAAEHAVVPDLFHPDPRLHTRTTLARWWERLTVAPNHVNFHLEHHLLPSIPPHRLRQLHQLLKERGFYDEAEISHGYGGVVAKLTVPKGSIAS